MRRRTPSPAWRSTTATAAATSRPPCASGSGATSAIASHRLRPRRGHPAAPAQAQRRPRSRELPAAGSRSARPDHRASGQCRAGAPGAPAAARGRAARALPAHADRRRRRRNLASCPQCSPRTGPADPAAATRMPFTPRHMRPVSRRGVRLGADRHDPAAAARHASRQGCAARPHPHRPAPPAADLPRCRPGSAPTVVLRGGFRPRRRSAPWALGERLDGVGRRSSETTGNRRATQRSTTPRAATARREPCRPVPRGTSRSRSAPSRVPRGTRQCRNDKARRTGLC